MTLQIQTIINTLHKFILTTLMAIMIFPIILPARADSIPIDCLCMEKNYPVYGKEQPVNARKGSDGTCSLEVVLEKKKDTPKPVSSSAAKPESDAAEAVKNLGKGLVDTLTGIPLVIASPFRALFSGISIKSPLDAVPDLLDDHTALYHEFLDREIFGKSIKKLSDIEDSSDLTSDIAKNDGLCGQNNPKPSCVVERALCSYEKYVGVLFAHAGKPIRTGDSSADLSQMLALIGKRDQALAKEAEDAKLALDTAFAVYSQFFNTYRLHLQFKGLINALVKVRDMTGSLRELVSCMPNKFVGVATTLCN